MDYIELYMQDARYRRYIDTCMVYEKKTLVDMLNLKTMQLVGDYYKANPPREEPKVKHDDNNGIGIIECGGC